MHRVCEECGETVDTAVIEKKAHTYSETVVEPTCTEDGKRTFSCAFCGDSYSEAISAAGHKEVVDAAVPATCTENGKTEGKHCSVCGKVLVEQSVIPAGHVDEDSDGYCDNCEKDLAPETRCGHICHAKDSLGRLIWLIVKLIYQIFKLNPSCSCGASHY